MKVKTFTGRWHEAQDAFNKWAKGKVLTKDVIIHTHQFSLPATEGPEVWLTIVVFHPEGSIWDRTEVKQHDIEA